MFQFKIHVVQCCRQCDCITVALSQTEILKIFYYTGVCDVSVYVVRMRDDQKSGLGAGNFTIYSVQKQANTNV